MKRTGRVILSLALFGTAVIVVTRLLPGARRSPVTEAMLRSPTTQTSAPGRGFLSSHYGNGQLVLAPPLNWYSTRAANRYTMMTRGDVNTGSEHSLWGKATAYANAPRSKIWREGLAMAHGDGLAFSTTPTAQVVAVDVRSTVQIWKFTGAQPVMRLAWSDSGTLVAASEHQLYGIDPDNGRLRWSADLGGTVLTDLDAREGSIFVGINGTNPPGGRATNPLLVAIDARDGRPLWRASLPLMPVGVGSSGDGAVYCAAENDGANNEARLLKLDAASGALVWQSDDIAKPNIFSPRPQGPAVGDGTACVALDDTLYAFDTSTGKQRWTRTFESESVRPPLLGWPTMHDSVVYFAANDGAFAVESRTGRELWNYRAPSPGFDAVHRDPSFTLAPTVAGNVIALFYSKLRVDFVRLPSSPQTTVKAAAQPIRALPAMTVPSVLLLMVGVAAIFGRLRTAVTLLSLAGFALTLWAWKESYSAAQFLGLKRFATSAQYSCESTTGLHCADGAVTVGTRQSVWDRTISPPTQGDTTSPVWWTRTPPAILSNSLCLEEPATDLGLRHFAWTHHSRPSGTPLGPQSETSVTVPLWFVAALFAILPFAWLTGLWRDRGRYPKGHCPNCGYDLRATPGRCPECGHDSPVPQATIQP
jgi:outer membrane protein assembly factor BamB